MECALCQSPLAEGATVCGACGSAVLADVGEVTMVAGKRGPDTTGGPPRGDVLAERWEIAERISSDALTTRYRAHDQETEAAVVLTLVSPELLPSGRERDAVRERLAAAVGVGNKFLPGLIDADREGQFVFTVEPFAVALTLRSVLDARRARGETMQVGEVLPVVAQLAAALAGLAPPLHHGDVRAERVLIGKDGLRLVGAFIVPALPAATVARALAEDDAWRRVFAPEAMRGLGGDAADRFGVAAIAFEALTGRLPGRVEPMLAWENGPMLGRSLVPVDEALRALLVPDPAARARSLDALVEALAECAHLPVPDLDPASFRRVRRSNAPRPGSVRPEAPSTVVVANTFNTTPTPPVDADSTSRTQALNADGELETAPSFSTVPPPEPPELETSPGGLPPGAAEASRDERLLMPDALPPAYRLDEGPTLAESALRTRRVVAIAGAAAGGTQELAMDELLEAPPAKKRRDEGSLDPRLVRAALSVEAGPVDSAANGGAAKSAATPTSKRDEGSLDPRLVRAALGVALDGAEEPEPATTLRAAARPKKSTGDTQQLTPDDLAEMSAAASRRSARVSADSAPPGGRRKRDAEPAQVVKVPRYEVAKASAPPPPKPSQSLPPPTKGAAIAGTLPLPPASRRAPASPSAPPARAPLSAPPARAPLSAPPARAPLSAPPARAPLSAPPARAALSAPPARAALSAPPPPARAPMPMPIPMLAPMPGPGSVPPTARPPSRAGAVGRGPASTPPAIAPQGAAQAPQRSSQRPPQRAPVATAEDLVRQAPRASNGRAIIWISVALALVILSVGAVIAWTRHAASADERERRLQQRFQQLRQQP